MIGFSIKMLDANVNGTGPTSQKLKLNELLKHTRESYLPLPVAI
jgi:hypothetical protein